MDLIQQFSYFTPLYEEVYELCRNTEKVMGMFSKELKKLDDNTVRYMMDEMQNTIDEQADTINNLSDQIADKDAEIEKLKEQLAQKEK
jgi:septal ring factor EnvC (AmiA/AmiB activator)